jgi:hypothetical protein
MSMHESGFKEQRMLAEQQHVRAGDEHHLSQARAAGQVMDEVMDRFQIGPVLAGPGCTSCGGVPEDGDLVPWSGERLCWPCTDTQLDLMAKAVQEATPVTIGQPAWGLASRLEV